MDDNKAFTIGIGVRFRDLDALGHVNNAVFFTYFEEGRKNFFQRYMETSASSAFNFILARISCDYIHPIKLNNLLQLQIWVVKIGNKSFTFKYRLADRLNERIVYAKGESTQVCFNYNKNKSIVVSENMYTILSEYKEK